MEKICNKDCFNCIYDDCILDSCGRNERKKKKRSESSEAQRLHRYYLEHKEEVKAKNLAYYREHREEINSKRRKAYKDKGKQEKIS